MSTNSATLINAVGAGLASAAVGAVSGGASNGSFLLFTNQTATGSASNNKASLLITEGFASAWRTTTQAASSGAAGVGALNDTQIKVTVAGLPTGVTAAIAAVGSSKVTTITLYNNTGAGAPIASITAPTSTNSSANVFVIDIGADSLTTTDSVQINFTLSGTASSLAAGTITATVTLSPLGGGLDSNSLPLGPGGSSNPGYPSYTEADLGPVTIGNILPANTTMLIPYAVKTGPYDTGIAIANTTADPFGPTGGSATPTAGTLSVFLFPRTNTGAGTSVTLTTSATVRPGVGLATDGTLAAGGTWTALMSDILTAAGQTGDFFGYLFIQSNFLNAHGAAYIFNGVGFTSSTPVLVLAPPSASSSRGNPSTGVESLDN